MARKNNYPQGVEVSDVPCGGHHNRYELDNDGVSTKTVVIPKALRKCPDGRMLKQRIADKKGDRCFKCWRHDHPLMNAGRDHGGDYKGGSGQPGSKGSPRKKGSGKVKSAGK